jgi:hypothetical protein
MAKRNAKRTGRRKTAAGSRRGKTTTRLRAKRARGQRRAPATAKKKARTRGKKKGASSKPRRAASTRPTPRHAKTTRRATPRRKSPRLDRERRRLEEIVPTPPSSLNLDRRGSAVRTGRAELAETLLEHGTGAIVVAGGDPDVNLETAFFSGDEAPGGDNQTPDQDIVDNIGRALGIEYQDQEELKSSDKIIERDRHRWELDPASSEDYKERK